MAGCIPAIPDTATKKAFYFVDRRCNMIKRGGENVSCVELENIIATHPKIQDIVVVGIKDSIRDEAIKAFVVLNEGETLSEEEFFRFCEQNMAKFKVPSYLEIRKICHVIARGK